MTRHILSLNDSNWRVGSVAQKPFGAVNDLAEARDWLPATVPGDVRLDLLRAGKISDPFFGDQNESSQWVDARDWWYEHTVELESETANGQRAFLVCDGIDYQSAIFFNGKPLPRHVGMFSRQTYELPTPNAPRSSSLAIRIWGSDALPRWHTTPAQKLWGRLIAPLFTPPEHPYPDRYATLKCQMQFGWDIALRLRTCGIWDDTRIAIVQSVFIHNVFVKAKLKPDSDHSANVHVALTLDSDCAQTARVWCAVRGKNFSPPPQTFKFDLPLERGKQTHAIVFDLAQARSWQPWDRGEPNLYDLEIRVESLAGEPFDTLTETFGVREFELACAPNALRGAEPWHFVVNGKREFLRGANWVPLDAIPGRLTRDDYAARLHQARDANINFLRVWGGGLREKRAFYDLCDELGILVWQEFPFAGAILDRFPRDAAFLDLVQDECGAIVRALRNHPSLVVWCGGNEFNTRGNAAIVRTLAQVVQREDGTRPFKPASPYRDESHNWSVWHRRANLRDYRNDVSPFLSEFGLQALPNRESLEKFLPVEAIAAPHRLWDYHRAQLPKLERYARSVLSLRKATRPSNLQSTVSELIDATQRAQMFAHQIAIEHVRRRKPQTAGVAIWQLNDCAPMISWSVIDYYGAPKRAYTELQKLYAPVLVSFDYPLAARKPGERVRGELWLINDLRSTFTNATVRVLHNDTEIFSRRVNIEADSAVRLDALEVVLAQGANTLRVIAAWGPAPLSDHEYDLNFCDIGEMNPLGALLYAAGKRLMK